MKSPLVSIVMPVYNASPFVGVAIESILEQTYAHFELIIINDGSQDDSEQIIRSFQDSRIRHIVHTTNIGIAKTRQEGISLARGVYLFWMDADDVSKPDRIEKQVVHFEQNPDLVISGTFAEGINEMGCVTKKFQYPTADSEIKARLIFGFPFMNPSLGIRMAALAPMDLSFLNEVTFAQDYVIISKLSGSGTFENIPEFLLQYREFDSPSRITKDANSNQIIKGRMYAWNHLLSLLGIKEEMELLLLHDKISYYPQRITAHDLPLFASYFRFLVTLHNSNLAAGVFSTAHFNKNVSDFIVRTLCQPLLTTIPFVVFWWQYRKYVVFADWIKTPAKRVKAYAIKWKLLQVQ